MKRRSFVKASLLTGAAGMAATQLGMAAPGSKKSSAELYELRVYTLKDEIQQKLVEDYFKNAAIPAVNRLGVKNVGVFTELKPAGQTRIFTIIPYSSFDELLKVQAKLAADADYHVQGAAYLSAPLATPAYDRIQSSLLQAFSNAPKMEVPEQKPRLFELRQYESPTETSGKKKIEMFNEAGEIGIFKRLGFRPVLFSETIIGAQRPNLTYMITFDDMDGHDRLWKAFGSDPDWKRLSSMPEYPGTIVSHITSTLLVPAPYSQI